MFKKNAYFSVKILKHVTAKQQKAEKLKIKLKRYSFFFVF